MLEDIKTLLTARYGDRWLNSIGNQNGMAEDLTIFERDITRISRKFGLVGRGMFVSTEQEIVARYEVIKAVNTLFDLDSVFYCWWGHRASENICFIQREIGDDEVLYHFVTGTPTHGHSGRVILTGREVRGVIQKRWERRMKKLEASPLLLASESASVDQSANN